MKISPVLNYYNPVFRAKKAKEVNSKQKEYVLQTREDFPKPVSIIPDFGIEKCRKIKTVYLIDKTNGDIIYADLLKHKNYPKYEVRVKGELAGYMHISDNGYLPECDNAPENLKDVGIHKITGLRTIMGNKYSGIGSALINEAIEHSKKIKRKGAIWLMASDGYDNYASRYMANVNPVPFYKKCGFTCIQKKTEEKVNLALKKNLPFLFPETVNMLLTPENAKKFQAKYSKKYCEEF